MLTTVEHPRLGEVVLSQSRRARRISISVRATGAVRLSFPRGVSQKRALAFLDEKAEWIEAARERLARKRAALAPRCLLPRRKPASKSCGAPPMPHLPDRIGRISRITGLKYNKLTIRASRTKWGSCTGTNNISLSLFLMCSRTPARFRHRPRPDAIPSITTIPRSSMRWSIVWSGVMKRPLTGS